MKLNPEFKTLQAQATSTKCLVITVFTNSCYRMGSSQRDDLYKNVFTPGPGTYSTRPDSASGPKFGFGSSERDPLYGMSKTLPGPGQYDFKGFTEEDPGKGTTLVPRRTDRPSTARVPGPGAYDPTLSTKNAAPAYRYNIKFIGFSDVILEWEVPKETVQLDVQLHQDQEIMIPNLLRAVPMSRSELV